MRKQSDFKRAFSEDGKHKTHIGGQALIEGVMMRGRHNWACAVRMPSGRIHIESHDLKAAKPKYSWLKLPLVRGVVAFVESLALGYKALDVANRYAYTNDDELLKYGDRIKNEGAPVLPTDSEINAWEQARYEEAVALGATTLSTAPMSLQDSQAGADADAGASPLGGAGMTLSMIIGVVLGAALFVVAPAFLTNLAVGEYDGHTVAWNMVDGIIRIAIFVLYVWLIGRIKAIQRMFGYHGAEHKTIHCFEHGLPLTPENALSFPRLHVRCGTAFLIMVMLIAIFVYSVVPIKALIGAWGVSHAVLKLALVIVVRLALMPLIAGISYEISVKWAGSHPENPLQMQYLTTREPDLGQIECAIRSMEEVIAYEKQKGADGARVSHPRFEQATGSGAVGHAYSSGESL